MSTEYKEGIKKDFFILLVSAFFIYTYNSVFMMTTPLIIAKMNGTELIAGLQGTLFLLTAIILRFYFGPLADARGRRLTMLIGSLSFLIAALLFFFAEEVWQVVALRLLQAVGLASYFPAAIATAAVCAGSHKGTYIGILRMVASLSLMIGPVAAIDLIENYRFELFIWCMTALALFGLLAVFFISAKVINSGKQALGNNNLSLQRMNFWPLLRKCRFIVGTTFAAAASYGILLSFAALYIKQNTAIVNAGYFFTLFSIGGIFANGTFGWFSDHLGRMRLTISSFVALGMGIIFFAYLPQAPLLFYPAGLLSGAGYYGGIAVLMAWMTDRAGEAERTAALSLQQNSIDLGIAFGSGVFGFLLVSVTSDVMLYVVLGAIYLCFAGFARFNQLRL